MALARGFGIAGHRNNYSTGVRNGNWVEDSIGDKLASGGAIASYDQATTEMSQNFIASKGKYEGESLVVRDARTQSHMVSGVPKSLLFYHGNDCIQRGGPPDDMYKTTAQRMNAVPNTEHLTRDPLAMSKSKYMSDEKEIKSEMFTTTKNVDEKAAARALPNEETAAAKAKPYDGNLPRDRGYRTFTSAYLPGIPNLRA